MEGAFKAFGKTDSIDFSYDLRDARDWNAAIIREVDFLSNVTTLAFEPVQGFLAVGTRDGKIAVFGGPAVGRITKLPKPSAIVSLQFAALVFKLLCVDQRGFLHVWDLGALGGPVLQASEKFEEGIQCLGISPSHSHALLGLASGAIVTYDLLCLCRSPYIIPSIWKLHEDKVESDMPIPPVFSSCQPMELVFHPRDLNLVFIAFIGGVGIYNLSTRISVRHYDLVIPPGAPGGVGYADQNLLQHRRQALTCMAVHPSGHIFATGYADGCIAFWAVDDEDKPILVRTINEVKVNIADAEKLSEILTDQASNKTTQSTVDDLREPIFKMSWSGYGNPSDPYGFSTLSVLGGLRPSDPGGVSVMLLKPFLQVSPTGPTRQAIHPDVRREMLSFLENAQVYLYSTEGPTQDFLLIPRDSPHLGGHFDPISILLLSESDGDSRSVEAREFPPSEFISRMSSEVTTPRSDSLREQEPSPPQKTDVNEFLANTLQELQLSRAPDEIILPTALWTGHDAILDGYLVHIDLDAHNRLLHKGDALRVDSVGRGGSAWVDYGDEDQSRDLRWTKYQAHRILVTHHDDQTVRFMDVSPQLLMGSSDKPLRAAFPAPLNSLIIHLSPILATSCLVSHSRPIRPEEAAIQSVQLTSETLECVVTLRSGHTLVYIFGDIKREVSSRLQAKDDEIVPLDHLAAKEQQFHPKLLVDNKYGNISTCESSNIGFVAIAYTSGALVIIDMRQSCIIFRDGTDPKANKRRSFPLQFHRTHDPQEISIQSMRWVICGYDTDHSPRTRLISSYRNGDVRVFTISNSLSGEFNVTEESKQPEGIERPLPGGMFVLDGKHGTSCSASRVLYADTMSSKGPTGKGKDETHSYLVVAGAKGAKCAANVVGGKVSKVEWGKSRTAECVEVISRSGAQALVAITSSREVLVYSLPSLDPLHTFQLQVYADSAINVDDTGDYVDWSFDMRRGTVTRASLGTLFAIRRVYDEPIVDFTSGRKPVPAMPQMVPLGPPSLLGSWFRLNAGLSSDQIDALFAGPNRPIPEETSTIVNNQWQKQMQTRAQELAKHGSRMGTDIYNNLTSAVAERGELLSGLEDRFRYLGEGGKKMMFEAKRLAAEQSAKRWLG